MRHTSKTLVAALFFSLAATPVASLRLLAAEKTSPSAAKPKPPQGFGMPAPGGLFPAPRGGLPSFAPGPAGVQQAAQAAATLEKLKELRTHLGRALSVACDLFSGNEANLLSGNKTALLSGNKPEILSGNKTALLSGNKPEILSGNKPAILSGNKTPIFSGNTLSILSNFKIEINIENSGNHPAPAPATPVTVRGMGVFNPGSGVYTPGNNTPSRPAQGPPAQR